MKSTINMAIVLVFVLSSALANEENRKEKKALVETIKKEYVVSIARDYQKWLIENYPNSNKNNGLNKSMESDLLLHARINNVPLDYKPVPEAASHRFKDFNI